LNVSRLEVSEQETMNEHSQRHQAYGDKLTLKLREVFPSDKLEIDHRAEVGGLHFSIVWGRGHDRRNMQLWIAGNALDDYLMNKQTAEAAEKRLLTFVKGKIPEMAADTTPQRVDVMPADVRVY
jgi:hypothetical protein